MATRKANLLNGIDAEDLGLMLTLLRAHGVTRLRSGELEVELGPLMPPRSLDDFATTGLEEVAIDDDGRFDHVGIRLKKLEPME